jgi:hypothetical protein
MAQITIKKRSQAVLGHIAHTVKLAGSMVTGVINQGCFQVTKSEDPYIPVGAMIPRKVKDGKLFVDYPGVVRDDVTLPEGFTVPPNGYVLDTRGSPWREELKRVEYQRHIFHLDNAVFPVPPFLYETSFDRVGLGATGTCHIMVDSRKHVWGVYLPGSLPHIDWTGSRWAHDGTFPREAVNAILQVVEPQFEPSWMKEARKAGWAPTENKE